MDSAHPTPEQSVGKIATDDERARLERRTKEIKERRRALFIAVVLIAVLAGVVIISTDRVLHKKPTTGGIAPARAG